MPPSLLPPLPTFPGAIWLNQGEATMATSVPANYYNSKPIDPAHFNHYIVNTIDALLENALKVEHGSATLKFLYKIFGPVDVATRIFELEHEGGFYWINGSKIMPTMWNARLSRPPWSPQCRQSPLRCLAPARLPNRRRRDHGRRRRLVDVHQQAARTVCSRSDRRLL
jgi:hypothetical protein